MSGRTEKVAVQASAAIADLRPSRVRHVILGSPIGLISLAVGGLLWEVIGQVSNVSFFPPLSAVLVRLFELLTLPSTWEYLAASLTNLVLGFGIALIGGIGLGLLMGMYRRVDMALDIYVRALLTAPALIFAPILFSLFGLNRITVVIVIILYSMFIMVVNTSAAVKGAPRSLVEMARSYGGNDRFVFRRVVLPAATPLIMAGVRLGAGRAVKGMINGEMFIAVVGLGGVVVTAGRNFDAETVLAVMILIIALAILVVGLVERIDRRLTSWLPETSRG